jgi:hypothetical protein
MAFLDFTLCSMPYALLFLQRHLDIVTGTLFGAKTASFAEVQVEFIQTRFRRNLNSVVWTVDKTIAAVIAHSTAKTSFSLIDNRFRIEGGIELFKMLQTHLDRQGFLFEPSLLLVIVGVQVLGIYHRRA